MGFVDCHRGRFRTRVPVLAGGLAAAAETGAELRRLADRPVTEVVVGMPAAARSHLGVRPSPDDVTGVRSAAQ